MKNLIGKTFGDWLVIDNTDRASHVLCKCIRCERTKVVDKYSLLYGRSTKCRSCSTSDVHSTKWKGNPIRGIYYGIRQRCYSEKSSHYAEYGGRGITLCDEWLNDRFSFYEWAMENGFEKGMSIERIDNNLGYCPSNCKVIPRRDQQKNRRNSLMVTINGERMCLSDACQRVGFVYGSVQMYRNRNHCSPQEAFDHFIETKT